MRPLDSAMGECYCAGARPSIIVPPLVLQRSSVRRALVVSVVLHVAVAAAAWWLVIPAHTSAEMAATDVDIEVAPPAPLPEALPPEAEAPAADLDPRSADTEPASTVPEQSGPIEIDAGIDARPDAAPDAAPDAPADAGTEDAGAVNVATTSDDAQPPDAGAEIASPNAGDAGGDAPQIASADTEPAAVAAVDRGSALDGAQRIADANAGADPLPTASAAIDRAVDAGTDAPAAIASTTGTATSTAPVAAAGTSPDGQGPGAALDPHELAAALAQTPSPSGAAGEPAVEGVPTTAGTAANLLAYFPAGHVITAVIRFDRLRGTEWAAQAERLLRPLPDYQWLLGTREADLAAKLETLVISSPRPRDAAATTLVARTQLARPALRDFLAATTTVTWSTATGGLLGKRTGKLSPGDRRVLLSPFHGWFLLAHPDDLRGLTTPARGNPDTALATAKLPPWLTGIRAIETETGDARGPAVVVTLGLAGKRYDIPGGDIGLGLPSIPSPERVSVAMELVPQGWLVRGNMRFASEADAAELVASVQQVQLRIATSRMLQLALGKRITRVISNIAFARNGARVSYATSISIADARALLAAAARQVDQYFARAP